MIRNYFRNQSIEKWEEIIFLAFGRTSLVQEMRTFFSALLPTSLAHANIFFENNFLLWVLTRTLEARIYLIQEMA